MLELSSKKPINHQAVKELAILTFDGRRSKILSKEMSVDEILAGMMPLLKDTTYVYYLKFHLVWLEGLFGGSVGGTSGDLGLVFKFKLHLNLC